MIDHLDHIVLTTARTGECIDFYTRVLGMKLERFGEGRMALKFGGQKINLHERGKEFEPKAMVALPGTLDICFIAAVPLKEVIARLAACNVPIIEGRSRKPAR
jgi:catechol 2,3-dioxygenase-like lactoylglutathione lyase family enzyme